MIPAFIGASLMVDASLIISVYSRACCMCSHVAGPESVVADWRIIRVCH